MSNDVYCRAISEVLKIPIEEVTDLQRHEAKHVCFASVYGVNGYDARRLLTRELRGNPLPEKDVFEEICKMLRFAWNLEAT